MIEPCMCHGRFWQHITGNHLSANRERSLAVVASLRFWHLDLSYDCGVTIVSLHRAWWDWLHGSIHTWIFVCALRSKAELRHGSPVYSPLEHLHLDPSGC